MAAKGYTSVSETSVSDGIPIHMTTTIEQLSHLGIKRVEYQWGELEKESGLEGLVQNTTKQTVNAFERLMAGKRVYPDPKTSRLATNNCQLLL